MNRDIYNPEEINQRFVNAFLLTLVFTLLSGAIRKWGTASGLVNNLILALQLTTPFLFVTILGWSQIQKRFWIWLGPYMILLTLMAFNPLNQTIYHGVLGIILHLGFWIILFVYLSTATKLSLATANKSILTLALIEIILGIIQYTLSPSHFLNRYVEETEFIARVGQAVRITGTFSYISGYGAFIVFFGMFLWGQSIQKKLSTSWLLSLLALGIVVSLMNGSRAILILYMVFFCLSMVSLFSLQRMGGVLVALTSIALAIILNLANIGTFLANSIENFYTRVETNAIQGEQRQRIIGPLDRVVNFSGDYPLFGMGLGATYQGANAIWGMSPTIKQYGYFEEEPERIVIEGGFSLLLFRITLIVVLIYYLHIPAQYSSIILILVTLYLPIIFNIYNGTLFLLGLIYVDLSYRRTNQIKQSVAGTELYH